MTTHIHLDLEMRYITPTVSDAVGDDPKFPSVTIFWEKGSCDTYDTTSNEDMFDFVSSIAAHPEKVARITIATTSPHDLEVKPVPLHT